MNEKLLSFYANSSFIQISSKCGNLDEIHSSKFFKEKSMNEKDPTRYHATGIPPAWAMRRAFSGMPTRTRARERKDGATGCR
jgi:hypothetical protein